MKITIEKHGESVSIDAFEDCLTTYQVVEVMCRMCHALGYHSQNIGSGPRKGHNAEKQRKNYDCIDWSKKPSAPRTEQPRSKSK